jgi:solute carrier family 25 (adenine nucleotide translocator) protein 4/5/6/31
MMMTSSTSTKYESSLGAIRDIIAKEGTISLFKGAGVSVLQSIGAALVLTGYNQLQTGVSKTLLK